MKGVAAEFVDKGLRATSACDDILGIILPRGKGLYAALLPSGGST
jgi:hypothetical protein